MICEIYLNKPFSKKRLWSHTGIQNVLSKLNPWDGVNSDKMEKVKGLISNNIDCKYI